MKIKLLMLSALIFLSGCESPPKPTPFPSTSEESTSNFTSASYNVFQRNKFEKKPWRYSMSINGSDLKNENYHANFWYLAQHAHQINLVGADSNINIIKNNLIQNGVTPNIAKTPTCFSFENKFCSDLVHVYFYRYPEIVVKN